MPTCQTHENHAHTHGPGCGHPAVHHDDHVDYLHDGHLHHPHGDHCDEHVLEANAANPDVCDPRPCEHVHGPGCGHPAVPHDNHVDYLVDGVLHHVHDGHCDHHGALAIAS